MQGSVTLMKKKSRANNGKIKFDYFQKNFLIITVAVLIVVLVVAKAISFKKWEKNKKVLSEAKEITLELVTESETETTSVPETTTKKVYAEPKTKPVGTTVPVTKDVVEVVKPPKQKEPQKNAKILNVPYINQTQKYPTGCESISAVMALKYAGYNISPETFIDNYLVKGNSPFKDDKENYFTDTNPYEGFMGSPYSKYGWGCYSPAIKNSLNKIINPSKHTVADLGGSSMSKLCEYIDNNTPVIMWATVNMSPVKTTRKLFLTYDDAYVTWKSPNHCLLLVGYDDSHYYFNDPLQSKSFGYKRADVEKAYRANGSQALAIVKYTPPVTSPTTTETTAETTTETTAIHTDETTTVTQPSETTANIDDF